MSSNQSREGAAPLSRKNLTDFSPALAGALMVARQLITKGSGRSHADAFSFAAKQRGFMADEVERAYRLVWPAMPETRNGEFLVSESPLSDGSITFDVVGYQGNTRVTFYAIDGPHAYRLSDLIRNGTIGFVVEEFKA